VGKETARWAGRIWVKPRILNGGNRLTTGHREYQAEIIIWLVVAEARRKVVERELSAGRMTLHLNSTFALSASN